MIQHQISATGQAEGRLGPVWESNAQNRCIRHSDVDGDIIKSYSINWQTIVLLCCQPRNKYPTSGGV